MGSLPRLPSLAERVKWARHRQGLTQEELAEKAGVSRAMVGNIESGIRKMPREISKIAKALDTSAGWLQFGDERIDALTPEDIEIAIAVSELAEEQREMIRRFIASLRSD